MPNLKGRAAPQFDSYLLAIEAALDGQGVALAPHFMVAEDLKIRPPCPPVSDRGAPAGALVSGRAQSDRAGERAIEAFRSWLKAEIAADPVMLRAA